MKRREFISLLSSAAAAWPLDARAQRGERMRHIGVLMNLTADDPEATARFNALAQGLQQFGWIVGRNVQIEYRFGVVDADRSRRYATELVALASSWSSTVRAERKTQTCQHLVQVVR